MRREKIAVIGVGGRTGTMFAFELRKAADILGVARNREVAMVKEGKLFVVRGKEEGGKFSGKVIEDKYFKNNALPDFIFLATKNPVGPPIKYYCSHYRGAKKPALIISQNGISASEEAEKAVHEVFGSEAESVRIIRVALFNPIDKTEEGGLVKMLYSLPVKGAFAQVAGQADVGDIAEIFKRAGLHFKKFSSGKAKAMELSKLFLNLIGMASASRGMSVTEGFKNKEVFCEEVKALREYVKAVRLSGKHFVNFSQYPVRAMADLLYFFPPSLLSAIRNLLAKAVSKGREGKPKALDEIEYYNGAVVELGKKTGIPTPANKEIYRRAVRLKENGR